MDVPDLVKRAVSGDKDALIRLVMDKKEEYFKLAYVYTENREDALDSLQDMTVILFNNIKRLKKQEAFYSWSKTILVNCCKSTLNKRKRIVFIDKYENEAFNEMSGEEIKQDILQSLKKLSKDQQEAIKLKYFMDMDYETIAAITKVPTGTVKSRIFNGLAKLREVFGGEYIEKY